MTDDERMLRLIDKAIECTIFMAPLVGAKHLEELMAIRERLLMKIKKGKVPK